MRLRLLALLLFLFSAASTMRCGAQSLSIAGIDTSGFPLVKARFYALDAGGAKITTLRSSDFTVSENGVSCPVVSVDCPADQTAQPISVVLTVDVSESMADPVDGVRKIDVARDGLRAFVRAMPLGSSECALTSFNDQNYLDQDFTTDPSRLLTAIDRLTPAGPTDYDAAFIRPLAGGLYLARSRGLKRVMILLTDGQGSGTRDEILRMALDNNITVYGITLGLNTSSMLAEVARRTGGASFDNVMSAEAIESIYRTILQTSLGLGSCEIVWRAGVDCTRDRDVRIALDSPAIAAAGSYRAPLASMPKLIVSPPGLRFGRVPPGSTSDLTVTLTAQDADVTITDFGGPTVGRFQLVAPPATPLTIPAGMSIPLTLRFSPTDSAIDFARFQIQSSACPSPSIYASGGYFGAAAGTLRLRRPNGGEVFGVGADTTITWEGILPTDTVRLDYSTDGGASWSTIADTATGLEYRWRVPDSPSSRCLARIAQVSRGWGEWLWAERGGGSRSEGVGGVAALPDGGVVIVGWFERSAFFADTTIYATGDDNTDAFLVKYRSDGTVAWVRRMGGPDYDYAYGVAVDAGGAIYVTGSFGGVADFGSGTSLTSAGGSDIFVAKYRPDGSAEWARRAGGDGADRGAAIAAGRSGELYVTGWFYDDADFGSSLVGSKGSSDAFLARYGSDGAIAWVRTMGDIGFDNGLAVAVAPDGDPIAAGSFLQSIDLTGGLSLSSAGGTDGYVMRFSPAGTIRWAERLGGAGDDAATAVGVDATGDIAIAASITGTAGIQGSAPVSSAGATDWLVARLAADGVPFWTKSAGGLYPDVPYALATDAAGDIYVAGTVTGGVKLDELVSNGDPNDGYDIYLAKYRPDGAVEWGLRAGAEKDDRAVGIAGDGKGAIYTGGTFGGRVELGATGGLASAGGSDAFVAKLIDASVAPPPDTSDTLWSIVRPELASVDVDMESVIVGGVRDSIVSGALRNTGTVAVTIDSVGIASGDAGDFALISGAVPATLAPGDALPLGFSFHPATLGARSSTIEIRTQAGTLSRQIVGRGLPPMIEVSAGTIDFGKIEIGTSGDTSLPAIIRNVSDRALTISATQMLGPNLVDFSTIDGGGAFTLAPGQSRRMKLRFSPSAVGRTSGRIAFDYGDVGSPASVTLFGEGYLSGAAASLRPADAWGAPGDMVDIPIIMPTSRNLTLSGATGLTASLRYNRTVLLPAETNPVGLIVRDRVEGNDRVLDLALPARPDAHGELARIHFIAALGNDTATDLRLESAASVGGSVLLSTDSGRFHLLGVCTQGGARLFDASGNGLKISAIRPSPAAETATIDLDLVEQGRTTISLIDMAGHEVWRLDEDLSAGHYTRTIDLRTIGSGSYLLLLRTPTQSATTRLTVIK
jgi:hypothetical protein